MEVRNMAVNPLPEDYPTVSPSLAIAGAADAIAFYEKVLGATTRMRMEGPDGKIGHAELCIGDSLVMVADEYPDMGFRSPKAVGGTPVNLGVYVTDVDAVFQKALDAGATEIRAVQNQFYGDRSGMFEDPWGHRWSVATHVEDVPPDEMAKRAEDAMKG
jgi:PhnB protein